MRSSRRTEAGLRRRWWVFVLAAAAAAGARTPATAQRPVTLEQAIAAAEQNAPRLAAVRADSAAASAEVAVARIYPNPALNLGYSQSAPQFHVEVEQPLEYPWVRRLRIRAAETAVGAAGTLIAAERAVLRYEVELAYARASGTSAIGRLARRSRTDAAELLRIARARQAAGDASELDVELAGIAAGQLRSAALADSLAALSSTLELQALMGLPADRVEIVPTDSVEVAAGFEPPAGAVPLRIAAARQQLAAQEARLALARRNRFVAPALRAGFEQHDPGGSENGVLPTVGITVPVPLFDRGRAGIAQAQAAVDRSRAELAVVERASAVALGAAGREREVARARAELDRAMVADAERVAALSVTAYREGAYPLSAVIEAQRSARDAIRQYLDELTASRTAEAVYRRALIAGGGAL